MKIEVLADSDSVALAAEATTGVRERGRFVLAVSGGRAPRQALSALAREALPWHGMHIVQVDERIAPMGHSDQNLTDLRACLLDSIPLREELIHDHFLASQGVEDDHMNVLCIGSRTIDPAIAWQLTEIFLAAQFSQAERHLRRIGKVSVLEAREHITIPKDSR